MRVLVINGSPRAKGNSDLLCDEFIRGAEEAGHQVEKILLRAGLAMPVSKQGHVSRKMIWQKFLRKQKRLMCFCLPLLHIF